MDSDSLSLEVRQILNDDQRDETTKERLINARLGQGQFREDLFRHWGRACAVTGCTVEHVLRASHIKPWKESDDKQRLDRFNGLLLSANLDALFDKHLISFDDQGKMLISEQLSDEEILLLSLSGQLRKPLNSKQKDYLKIHRTKHQETVRSA
jgi:putative restriction endonuclease